MTKSMVLEFSTMLSNKRNVKLNLQMTNGYNGLDLPSPVMFLAMVINKLQKKHNLEH